MLTRALIVSAYFVAVAAVGLGGRRAKGRGAQSFFLAGRTLTPLVLLATMAATNFSGFTVVGFSGAGYRLGLGFYPVMAYGTGFMAVSFALVGLPAWRLGKRFGLITPPELMTARFGSPLLTRLFAGTMVVFTLPYLAIQPMAAGYVLESLLGLPYAAGAGIVSGLVLAYVLAGGMRSVVWTDVFQGLTMLAVLSLGLVAVLRATGGATAAFADLASKSPEYLSRPGAGPGLHLGVWFSYMILWTLADPMFPQLFQRFYASKDERSIVRTMTLYPVVTSVLFFFPVAIGVLGRLRVPGLSDGDSDRILPMLMESLGGDWLVALAAAGLVAGIMSTMDSQLLTLSSIIDRDIAGGGRASLRDTGARAVGRCPSVPVAVTLVALSAAGYLLALKPLATILAIATETFSGLAVLLPSVLAAIYWRRASARAAVLSIAVGEIVVVLYHFAMLPRFGLLPAIPATAVAAAIVVAWGSLARPADTRPPGWADEASTGIGRRAGVLWGLVLASLLGLSIDWWKFGELPRFIGWAPDWLVYFFALSALLTVALGLFGAALLAARRKAVGDGQHAISSSRGSC